MADISPLGRKIVAEPVEDTKRTATGLYLAGEKKDTHTAKVVATGPKVKEVKKGDVILYDSYRSTYEVGGKEYVIVNEKEVLAVVK